MCSRIILEDGCGCKVPYNTTYVQQQKEKAPLKTADSTSTSVRQELHLRIFLFPELFLLYLTFVIYPAISKHAIPYRRVGTCASVHKLISFLNSS